MKVFFILVFLACFAGDLAAQRPEPFVKDELLVKLRGGQTRTKASATLARLGLRSLEALGDTGWRRVSIRPGERLEDAIARITDDAAVESAQPNFYYHLAATPNDPLWGNANLYGLPKISAPQAWDLSTGSSTVVVANIDSGMRYTHEDLAPNMWTNPGEINGNGIDDDGNGFADDYFGFDFYFNDPDPIDEHGHGTHTGGTIGAAGNNLLGVVGVNWNVKIMAIKIYDSDGFGTTSAMLINAYNYVRMMKERGVNIRVTNNSYAGCDEACGYDQATKDALDALGDAGVLNVFAAGNDAWNNDTTAAPAYPAAYTSPTILTAAASTSTDARAGFSNWGPVSVDLAAPGSSILSTTRGSNSSYGLMSGTSMAAPHVTGAAALLSAFDPSLSVASLKATLMNTVDPLTNWASTPIRTNGRLNVLKALQNPTVCTFELSAKELQAKTKGGYFTVNVTAPPNCDYELRKNVNWVVWTPQAYSGDASVTFWVRLNSVMNRSTTVTIAGQPVVINQTRP